MPGLWHNLSHDILTHRRPDLLYRRHGQACLSSQGQHGHLQRLLSNRLVEEAGVLRDGRHGEGVKHAPQEAGLADARSVAVKMVLGDGLVA